jgi:hypothetical protein
MPLVNARTAGSWEHPSAAVSAESMAVAAWNTTRGCAGGSLVTCDVDCLDDTEDG